MICIYEYSTQGLFRRYVGRFLTNNVSCTSIRYFKNDSNNFGLMTNESRILFDLRNFKISVEDYRVLCLGHLDSFV